MGLRDRIFDLIFADRRKKRSERRRRVPDERESRKPAEDDRDGYDGRYFVRRRR